MGTFGSNIGYVDELYARYLANPEAVSEAWREFFADYRPSGGPAAPPPAAAPGALPPPAPRAAAEEPPSGAELLEGAAARIAGNMEASLGVPTATSVRTIPVKLLEENRRLINQHRAAHAVLKISFTHLIAWAVVRAVLRHPAMNARYLEAGGKPYRVPGAAIGLGLAIDLERRGERLLLVPNLKDAGSLDFPSFVAAYDDLVTRARQGKLAVEDFHGTTVTLTNPGTVGTALSVPRLMSGQGTIVGTGAIGYAAQYAGMNPGAIAELGLSKVMTVTSTYDHRIIQGAESGSFLAMLEALLLGEHGFYRRIFHELAVPHEPVRWSKDTGQAVGSPAGSHEVVEKQARVLQLIRAYRVRGHLAAHLDPLGAEPALVPELEMAEYGLTLWDLDRRFLAGGLAGESGALVLREILEILRETYCRHVGVEFYHIPEPEVRRWLERRMERTRNAEALPRAAQSRILEKLNAAEAFERFLHATYVGHKRFSLEGAEALIPALDALLNDAVEEGIEEAVVGMAHRGRLNVLANIVGKSYGTIFREFEGTVDPESREGSGDVKYHLGARGAHEAPDGRTLPVVVASNPSHLEAVDPVVEGMTRARQDRLGDSLRRSKVLPVLIHGDAAFSGQGVVAETLNLSQLEGYRTGGTVHIVVNNQIGFTTGPREARSSPYATDVAKSVRAPIFHVNGDNPEDAVRAIRLALAFRQEFHRDAVVDLVCYRRWGHNESDDPSYTHPILYAKIEKHRSVRKLYTEHLLRRGDIGPGEAEASLADFRARLDGAFEEVRLARAAAEAGARPEMEAVEGIARPGVETAVARPALERVIEGLDRVPESFEVHPKLAKQLARRKEEFHGDRIDWAQGEALAFGSLVLEGTPVRLSGQDSGRGTFSQRHAVLHDHRTAAPHVPLACLADGQAPFRVHDSLLSEFAVLGFEYGYSVDAPETLVVWEAQFGDFANGAQVVIDQFLAAAEEKWEQRSGLTLLLPHGYEGQGPEHSSARVERFLQLCARGNLQVAWPSTPSQYFHLLRRQVRRSERKPLVVLTPKSLLRHREAVSSAAEFSSGTFREVLDDGAAGDPSRVRRVVLSAGKVFYDLDAHRREAGVGDVALLRIEQLYPFPAGRLQSALARYAAATDIVWTQEEPRNMGAWTFLSERLPAILAKGQELRYAGRPRSASPATGSYRRHVAEQKALVAEAFAARPLPAATDE
jgi:multifunctional 2-oxoglutarate metabolism enzyme